MAEYTEEFIARVAKAYPGDGNMLDLAQRGAAFLGRVLCDSMTGGISINHVLERPLEELRAEALRARERTQLYVDFCSGICYKYPRTATCPKRYGQSASSEVDDFFSRCPSRLDKCSAETIASCWELFDEQGFKFE